MSRRQVVIVVVAGVVLGLFLALQIVLPSVVQNEVESRLTEGGGSAEVSVTSFPAERLLWQDGESIEVSAEDLDLTLVEDTEVFSTLDGFDDVDVSVSDSVFGPFEVSSFSLTRSGEENYRLVSSSSAAPSDLAEFGADTIGIPGGDVIGGLLDLFIGPADVALPIEMDMELASDEGRVSVVSGGSTVAGIPTGPLAELIVGAIVSQL